MRNVETISNVRKLEISDLHGFEYLYHGTYTDTGTCEFNAITKIDLTKGKKVVDFGRGFYLTPDINQAEKRAKSVCRDKGAKKGEYASNNKLVSIFTNKVPIKKVENVKKPIVLKYPTQPKNIKEFTNLHILAEPCIEWLQFIFNNRKREPDLKLPHNHDARYGMVYGYMADGLFKEVIKLFERDYNDLKDEELQLIYSTFTAREDRIETQISIHNNYVINHYLVDGEIIELG